MEEITEEGIIFTSQESLKGFLALQDIIVFYNREKEKIVPKKSRSKIMFHEVLEDDISKYTPFIKIKNYNYGIWMLSKRKWYYNFILFYTSEFIRGIISAGEMYNIDPRIYVKEIFSSSGDLMYVKELSYDKDLLADANYETESEEDEEDDAFKNTDITDTQID